MIKSMFRNDIYQVIKPGYTEEKLFFQDAFAYIVQKETYLIYNQNLINGRSYYITR